MRESCGGRGIGQVVRRHVNSLEARDRTFLGRGDAFLQVTHLSGERGLITYSGRRTSEKRGHFRTRLRETEHVIHEQEHVLVLFVAEIFRHGKRGKRHAQTRAGGFVHLTINEADA